MPRKSALAAPPRRKRRKYNVRLVKRDLSYTIQEIAELFGLHPQAVRRWIKDGLPTIDGRRPIYIHGSDLIAYLTTRQSRRKRPCRPNEFYCCRCRAPRRPEGDRIGIKVQNDTKLNLAARCGACGARMNRAGSMALLAQYREVFVVETTTPPRIDGSTDAGVPCHFKKEADGAQLQSRE